MDWGPDHANSDALATFKVGAQRKDLLYRDSLRDGVGFNADCADEERYRSWRPSLLRRRIALPPDRREHQADQFRLAVGAGLGHGVAQQGAHRMP